MVLARTIYKYTFNPELILKLKSLEKLEHEI